MATKQKKPKRSLTSKQKADAQKSARRHGRSKPGLWENVNASKGKGPKSRSKGRTRPGKRNNTKNRAKKKRSKR